MPRRDHGGTASVTAGSGPPFARSSPLTGADGRRRWRPASSPRPRGRRPSPLARARPTMSRRARPTRCGAARPPRPRPARRAPAGLRCRACGASSGPSQRPSRRRSPHSSGGGPAELGQRAADEHLVRHEAGHGVARKSEDEGVAARAEPDRLARLDRDLVEDLLDAEVLEGARDEIVLAGADAAGRQHDVRAFERSTEARGELLRSVGDEADLDDFAPRRAR